MESSQHTRAVSQNCIELIKSFEGLFLNAYYCPAHVPTIGFGTIKYPDGAKVKIGDCCTEDKAIEFLMYEVNQKAKAVNNMLHGKQINQHQFDALVSFAYNLGTGALSGSTLLKKVLVNPNDVTIAHYKTLAGHPVTDSCEFLRWTRAGSHVLNGLVRRRAAEADLYRKPV